ncbi:MAG: ABC transporter permease [Myxococcota bacterium]
MKESGASPRSPEAWVQATSVTLSGVLLFFMALPVVALVLSSSPVQIWAGLQNPLFLPAFRLTLITTGVSLGLVALTGTPLAWWLASRPDPASRMVRVLVDIPIVLPPAVMGVALLQAFGRRGLLGPVLEAAGLHIPFTTAAVVLAQVVVSAPFFVQSAVSAFRTVDFDALVVARTLGASAHDAFFQVALPAAAPGLVSGCALAWARSAGEFGATLLFAGNLTGTTQTLPLAIYTALESDLEVAVALSLILSATSVVVLVSLRSHWG